MIPLGLDQIEALRCLRAAYPDAKIAIIGAAALGFHLDMTWRRTADLDLVIAVAASAIDTAGLDGWQRDRYQWQRWNAPNGTVVDLVPAPPEVLAQRELVWPETGHTMNMAGMGLALDASTTLLDAGLAIAVPDVPVIALLKMAAFVDRPYEREKDLIDLAHILADYPPPTDDRLFSEEVLTAGREASQAQAFVLGCELRVICDELDRKIVDAFLEITSEDVHWSRFVRQSPWRNNEDNLQRRVDALRHGFAKPVTAL